jgi:hypothetical protein
MTVQLVLLKSGEELIADVREIIDKETEKQMSLVFIRPVRITVSQQNVVNEESTETQNIINFEPWLITSKNEQFLVPYEWVVTICNPKDDILDSYITNVGVKEDDSESDSAEDQSVSDLGD